MTKRQWHILQHALLAYRAAIDAGTPGWDTGDGVPPAGEEIDDLAQLVGAMPYEPTAEDIDTKYACDRCGRVYDEARGDGYCGLCPECADATDVLYRCQTCRHTGDIDDFTADDISDGVAKVCPACQGADIVPANHT